MGEMITFASNGGTAGGYLAQPAGGPGPGVIVIQEWWGLNAHIKAVADRFAAAGFTALAPDLYHGQVTDEPDEAGKLYLALKIDQVEKDLRGAIAHVKGLTGSAVGTVGFCLGGALSLFAACTNGPDVGACVDYYGGHPAVTYDFNRLTAPVLCFWAENDDFVNPTIPAIEGGLRAAGKTFRAITYPGTQHAFFNDERPESHDRNAATDSWEKMLQFYRENL